MTEIPEAVVVRAREIALAEALMQRQRVRDRGEAPAFHTDEEVAARYRAGVYDGDMSVRCAMAALQASPLMEVVEALRGIQWRSDDRDNMEFAARITYVQMDRIRAALAQFAPGEEG